jgi:hypothetical protein
VKPATTSISVRGEYLGGVDQVLALDAVVAVLFSMVFIETDSLVSFHEVERFLTIGASSVSPTPRN